MDHVSATSLPPGFRFQPKEDELFYYLKHKVYRKPLNFALEPIADVDVYKVEPWDLPGNSRDRECYFFSALGRIGNGSRIKRTTEKGYWKITGKDRAVRHNSRTLGMKRILVFRIGRSPRGDPTNWVMHEYRLVDEELEKAGIAAIDAPVLCKIFQKTGTGPQNGEVSFGEVGEEHDDMGVVVPGEEAAAEEVVVGDGENVNAKELDQDKSNYFEYSGEFNGGYQQPFIGTGETSGLHHGHKFDLEQYGMDANPLRDGSFIEDNDLSNPLDPADVEMADKLLNLDNDFPDMDFDSSEGFYTSEFLGTENTSSHQTLVAQKNEIGEADQVPKESLHLSKLQGSNDASSSKHNPTDFDMADGFLNSDHDLSDINFDSFDPSEFLGTENTSSHQTLVTQENEIGEADQVSKESLCLSKLWGSNDASSSKHNPKALMDESGVTFSGNFSELEKRLDQTLENSIW